MTMPMPAIAASRRAFERAAGAEVSADCGWGEVSPLRGAHFASVQGHLESILSRDGIRTLERLVAHAVA